MSITAGQSLLPYPWRERRKFHDARRLISHVVKVTRILAWIAAALNPASVIFWIGIRAGYRRYNDSWHKRGLRTIAFGIVLTPIISPNPSLIFVHWYEFLRSFGSQATTTPQDAAISAFIAAFPYTLIAQGIHGLARSYQIERTTDAFLREQRPTWHMRWRHAHNRKALVRGTTTPTKNDGYVRFGVIEDDRLPWRRSRYGMVVERKLERMGHGVFIGSNGMGKTKAAETFTHYVLSNNAAMIYIDFKASVNTRDGLAAIAEEVGQPLHILDIGLGNTDTSWYDLFDWPGSPADKASVLVECFQFADGEGGAAYYRGIAEAWIPMQIEAAELLGLNEGEGMFDFLLATSVPQRFRERITPLRDSDDPEVRAKFEEWDGEASLLNASDLHGLRNELNKVINAAGPRLKPNAENPTAVSMKDVMDNGGLLYIGIASAVNNVVVKVLGSFLFKQLSILAASRSRAPDTDALRDTFVFPDEASQMGERAVMMNPIYTMAREARIFLWPLFQSFAEWDDSTKQEIQSNARNFVAFAIPSRESAAEIASTIPDVFAMQQRSEEQTRQKAFQDQVTGISGDTQLSIGTDAFLRPHIELAQVPKYYAYIWFQDAPRISRNIWWGKRRVRNDHNKGDAPLVRLIPYETTGIVNHNNTHHRSATYSKVPSIPTVTSTRLPDGTSAQRTTGPGGRTAHESAPTTSRIVAFDETPGAVAPPAQPDHDTDDAPPNEPPVDAAPAMPNFSAPGTCSHRTHEPHEGAPSGPADDAPTTENYSSPATTPRQATGDPQGAPEASPGKDSHEDRWSDDGIPHSSAGGEGQNRHDSGSSWFV